MTDITTDQGNTYRLVEIGDQCWFADNLKEIPSSDQGWYGFYDNAQEEPEPGEGMLYTWEAAMNGETEERAQGVCPTGWHVSSQCETELFRFESGIGLEDLMVVKSKLIYVGVPPSEFAAGELNIQNGKFCLRGILSTIISSSKTLSMLGSIERYISNYGNIAEIDGANLYAPETVSLQCLKD